MKQILEKALSTAAALTFEELGFILPSPDLTTTQRQAPGRAVVSVEFHGPLQGKLWVALYGNILSLLTANMLGEDTIPSEQQQQDALQEICNVICGNMLPKIAGTEAVFQIGTPEYHAFSTSIVEQFTSASSTATIGLDEGRADLCLVLWQSISSEESSA